MRNNQNPDQTAADPYGAYWASFNLFPEKWLENLYRQSLFILGIPALPFILFVVIALGIDLAQDTTWRYTGEALSEWQEIYAVLAMCSMAFAFRAWARKIHPFFRWLLEEKLAGSQEGDDRGIDFLNTYQQSLNDRRGRIAFIAIGVAAVMIFNGMADIPASIANCWQGWESVLQNADPQEVIYCWRWDLVDSRIWAAGQLIVWVFGFSIWALYASLAAWPIFVTGKFIARLGKEFKIRIQPGHPDSCGGLKPIGDFSFSMVMPLVIGGLFGAALSLSGIFLDGVELGPVIFSEIMDETVVFASGALLLLILPFSLLIFFMPIWDIHQVMAVNKRDIQNDFADRLEKLEQTLRDQLAHEDTVDQAAITAKKIEMIQVLNPEEAGVPVWPFDRPTVAKVFSPILLNAGGISIKELISFLVEVAQE